MTGKSTRLALIAAVSMLMMVPQAGAQGVGDAIGPPCADIANTTLGYSGNFTTVLLLVDFNTQVCDVDSNVAYDATLYTSMGQEPADSVVASSTGTGSQLLYEWKVGPTEVHYLQGVCSEASTTVSGHPADYSPDRSSPEVASRIQCTSPTAPPDDTWYG